MSKMKQYLVICLLLAIVHSKKLPTNVVDTWNRVAEPFREGCANQFNVDLEIAKNIISNVEAPNEKPVQCYLKCILDKVKFLTPEGDFDKTVIVDIAHFLPGEVVERCTASAASEKDLCQKAYISAMCALNAVAES